tara:strand:- start:12125 stop:21541 length:9417 start_codon:yes stop_codon:yes gene_type:complete
MSIKKLFDSAEKTKNYISEVDEKEAFSDVESSRNTKAAAEKQNTFIPQVDYRKPPEFVKYGSAYLYYKGAIEWIHDYYPYDGSDAEINEYYNSLLDIDKYIFDNLYPRTNGFITIANDQDGGWGGSTNVIGSSDGYGIPSTLEYITFKGGPGTGSASNNELISLSPNPYSNKLESSNIYKSDIYSIEGYPSDYGSGSRESNLKSDFGTGVTVEFWLKTGSAIPLSTLNSETEKQVIFDMWNNNASTAHDYGRLTIELNGTASSGSPFILTVQSGASTGDGLFQQSVGASISVDTLAKWHHYAFVIQNTGSGCVTKFYVDGVYNDTLNYTSSIGELPPKDMMGRIGALLTTPSETTATGSLAGAGKLSGSVDEFRFWKSTRSGRQIGTNWFTHARGGTNTDVSNADLGIYYKFNEGITTTTTTDSIVLDYSGRVSNGVWTGYGSNSRSTGSAIVLASGSSFTSEYKDPIVYSFHPDVSALKTKLLESGSYYDRQNNSSFLNMVPSWVIEEDEDTVSAETSELRKVTHIVGTYLDKLYLQISQLPKLKHHAYTSASHAPYTFAQHLPQSLGLYTPEIFVDSTIMEKILNKTLTGSFENSLTETKNAIYINLYNNLTNIYKSKGTERAIRNVFRCFNVDEGLIRLNAYAHNEVFELKNNLKHTVTNKETVNFNNKYNISAVVFQKQFTGSAYSAAPNDVVAGDTIGYISGSQGAGRSDTKHGSGDSLSLGHAYETPYGFTMEANVMFPTFNSHKDKFDRTFLTSSLFGLHTVNTASATVLRGDCTQWVDGYIGTDNANFQVMAIKDEEYSKNVRFMITSSNQPFPFPFLTSSNFFDVYNNQRWNLSVRLVPSLTSSYSVLGKVSGSIESESEYDLIFKGYNSEIGTIQNSFLVTASINHDTAVNFLTTAKRAYAGARRTNITGAVLNQSDIILNSIKYWTKYIEDGTLEQHAHDFYNAGASGSYQNISPKDESIKTDVLGINSLALYWNFTDVTGSDANGNFIVTDMSSGSLETRNSLGWYGNWAGYQHTGYGYGFATSSTDVIKKLPFNTYKFIDPERVVSSDMIQILSEDDKLFGGDQNIPKYYYTIEKSMYNIISEEMLKFFAGVVDFNNIIGEPINRYRDRYKSLEKLRQIFFRRVTKTTDIEKFVEYYKWFDDALTTVISQLIPASADFENDMLNTIESHVLERNKYQTKYPTIEFSEPDLDAAMKGIREAEYSWAGGSSTIPESPRSTKKNKLYWRERAERSATEISSSRLTNSPTVNSTIDNQRNNFKEIIYSTPHLSQSTKLEYSIAAAGTLYQGKQYITRSFGKIYNIHYDSHVGTGSLVKGGVNFTDRKNIDFTYNALRPGGPVNNDASVFIPLNVLVAYAQDILGLEETHQDEIDKKHPRHKTKRYFKTIHGRNYEYDGTGYSNIKSSFAFPFNIISSSLGPSGYNKRVVERLTGGIELVNLHHDTYGDSFEVPMQGPFTNYAVGGHQSRHIELNTGSSPDQWYNRPEAWKLLLGTTELDDDSAGITGAIGMVAPDYPWPEANEPGALPYPMTASQKAWLYRDFVAKRPVNIRNIAMTTGSTITVLGNYQKNYQIVNSVGAIENPRAFIEEQPTLPASIYLDHSSSTTNVRTFLDIRRGSGSHFKFVEEYNVGYLTGTENKSIIVSRFSAPGGIEVLGRGYRDFKSSEFSVYNALNYKNLSVFKPSQGPSGSFSEEVGTGSAGIVVRDIHNKDFGLISHLARHSDRFGRDSLFVTTSTDLPGAAYDQLPSFHKVNRNRLPRLKMSNDGDIHSPKTVTTTTTSKYDNFYIQHPIPRSTRQYSWISSSITSSDIETFGYAPSVGDRAGYFSSSVNGFQPFFNFVSASAVVPELTKSLWQPTNRLNILTYDPITASDDNTLGFPFTINNDEYLNKTIIDQAQIENFLTTSANYFNLLMTKRGGTFGWNWKRLRMQDHPILRNEQLSGTFSRAASKNNAITVYNLPPVSMRGRPMIINYDLKDSNTSIKLTHNNEKIYFNDAILNDSLGLPNTTYVSPGEQILSVLVGSETYHINWVLYSQNIFPSVKNEFISSSRERIGYNNKFWRDSGIERIELGNAAKNSFAARSPAVSQSSWPLDAPHDFLTRSSAPDSSTSDHANIKSGSAGELQNNYFSYHIGVAATTALAPQVMKPAALYARKHMISSPYSIVSPSGMDIPETGSVPSANPPFRTTKQIDVFGGEALWEAASQAGIVTISGSGTPIFQATASNPWFDDYDAYKEDLLLLAREYSIVPEFRISKHVEDYVKYGISSKNKTDTFQITGTPINSSTSSFYLDYSNSEFLHDFLKIRADSLLNAKEIRLVCSAAIRFNPYKGFYPAQRTVDLVSQFSRSYGAGLDAQIKASNTFKYSGDDLIQNHGGLLRPLMQTLYSPGVLYNSIKSGLAVEYPGVTDPTKLSSSFYGSDDGYLTHNWAITPNVPPSSTKVGYRGGEFWDVKIPFEAILAPEKYIQGIQFIDIEPHPSASLNATASLGAASDEIYSMMASNFFGEVGSFFLKDSAFTKLTSNAVTDDLRFQSGSVYGARIKLRRSVSGSRDYRGESGSIGNGTGYGLAGADIYDGSNFGKSTFPIPQDPRQGKIFQESFTMYSRPSAFGPAIAGQPDGTGSITAVVVKSKPLDSFNGFNWSFTPPYYNGEAWCDLIFRPSHTKSYDLEQILAEVNEVYWRADPGYGTGSHANTLGPNPILISSFGSSSFTNADNYIYSGHNVNSNAMQISASLNLFGVERIMQQEQDSRGNQANSTNITVAKKWTIQPKWETPMLNFNNKGVHPITNTAGNLSLPTFASASVPRGMWHQFGVLPDSPDKGVFLEIGDIPTDWLKNHYDIILNDTVYNDNDADGAGAVLYKKMKSLTDLAGFSTTSTSKRLGEVAESVTIREAIVAIPYVINSIEEQSLRTASALTAGRKEFINIPKKRYQAALKANKGTSAGDSLDAAGESIRKLMQKMERYVLPPQFDFLNNPVAEPIVMYMFEFEYTFDKDDLIYIWQNLSPRESDKISFQYQSVAHELINTELLSEQNFIDNDNLRWMVFKVKQKAQTNYYDLIVPQVGESAKDVFSFDDETDGYKIGFNWPYDFVSFVEMIKIDADILFHNPPRSGSAGTRSRTMTGRPRGRGGGY